MCVIANDLSSRDGDPQSITGALSRECPLGSGVAGASRHTSTPEAEPSAATEAGAGCNVDGVCRAGGRDVLELNVDVSGEQESSHVL